MRAFTPHRLFLAPGSKIRIGKEANFSLGGNLWFGVQQMEYDELLYGAPALLHLAPRSEFLTSHNATIGAGTNIWLYPEAKLKIGKRSYINMDSKIFVRQEVEIGNECAIGFDVKIFDDDFHPIVELARAHEYFPSKPAKITIEDHVWIGAGCTILKGVTIGTGSIIAAGTVITKNVPPNSLIGGAKAKVLKEETTWIL